MSRYDILLNQPKKDPPQKEHNPAPPSKPITRPPDEATRRPDDEGARRPIGEATYRPDSVPTGRREFIRRGFEWYADQLRALKKLSLEEQMEGKPGNMSQMVRDALDDYLKKRAAEK
jgi:hypothetical protein